MILWSKLMVNLYLVQVSFDVRIIDIEVNVTHRIKVGWLK